jgi:prepilin-type N-terminal cleavage/methylation domain-containing protein
MRDQRGFTLVETICALCVISLSVLLISHLSYAVQAQQRRSDLEFAVSREAVSVMSQWRARIRSAETGVHTRDLTFGGVVVRETERVQTEGGLLRITLDYAWQEGGRTREQKWSLLRSP